MKKLISIGDVKNITGFGSSWIYKKIQDNEFPSPIKIGRSSRWDQDSVNQWISEQIQETNSELSNKEPV